MVHALETFLCSRPGLEVLSLMLDNINEPNFPKHELILGVQGPSLKVLVWICRKQKPQVDDYSPRSFLGSLFRRCTSLQELSISLDVRKGQDFGEHFCGDAWTSPFNVTKMHSLTTLHIQIPPFPDSRPQENKEELISYLNWSSQSRQFHPSLKLIAVGPLTFDDRYLVNREDRTRSNTGPDWPVFFDVQTHRSIFGRCWNHALHELKKFDAHREVFIPENVNGIQQAYPNTRIFDSYWLK